MNILDRTSVKIRMLGTFLFVSVLLVLFGALSLQDMRRLGTLIGDLHRTSMQVTNAALEAQAGVVRMHRDMKDVAMSTNQVELLNAVRDVQAGEMRVFEQLDIVRNAIRGEEGKVLARDTRTYFANWKPIRSRVIALAREDKHQEAALITQQEGAAYVRMLEHKMTALAAYSRKNADEYLRTALETQEAMTRRTITLLALIVAVFFAAAFPVIRHFLLRLGTLQQSVGHISRTGELVQVEMSGKDEIAELAVSFNEMVQSLRFQFWYREGLNDLNRALVAANSVAEVAGNAVAFICRHLAACSGAIFQHDPVTGVNKRLGSFALAEGRHWATQFAAGEGVVGQVAQEGKAVFLTAPSPEDALLHSGTAQITPQAIWVLPVVHKDALLGVLEVATQEESGPMQREFLEAACAVLATAMHGAGQRERIDRLYDDSRKANTALEVKGRELETANQQLAARNEELGAQAVELKAQSAELQTLSEELMQQKGELEVRRVQVEEADRLKSEFLSNMSHELRTPLNSILALSQLMLTKGTGRDLEKESEYLRVVERNGRQLLSLINDILDLSKIEAGRMDVFASRCKPSDVLGDVVATMLPLATKKGLGLSVADEYGETMISDRDKLYQILLNLVSNAVKFTESGTVDITLKKQRSDLIFSVADTGIGIPSDQLQNIFDEFRQVDGSTTRRHEGTGLGLSICKKLAKLLGGDLQVRSRKEGGSVFTLQLPIAVDPDSAHTLPETMPAPLLARVASGDKVVLVVDDNQESRALLREHLQRLGYGVLEAENGRQALEIARTVPLHAITLDIIMPEMDGWEVLRRLKLAGATRDIPVIIVSVGEDQTTGMALGASGYIVKPVDRQRLLRELQRIGRTRTVRSVLIVDDDEVIRESIAEALRTAGYEPELAAGGRDGLETARRLHPDAMILDLLMPDMDGFQVLEQLRVDPQLADLPVLVVTAKDLSAREKSLLTQRTSAVLRKGGAGLDNLFSSIDRVLKTIGETPARSKVEARGRRVLVVEDNSVAAMQITMAMEELGCIVHHSADGKEAMDHVEHQIPDLIIMDLMMPGVDGFELLESLRSKPESARLPVVVLTAKELTADDRRRLSHNNIFQLIRKGSVDRNQLKQVALNAIESYAPLPPEPAAPEPEPTFGPSSLAGLGGSILVVEDNEDNLITIKAVLDDYTGRLLIARDGRSAVTQAESAQPDLILMDIQLPGMSGLEATRLIKAKQQLRPIPIIALTARAMRSDREEMLAAGCSDIVTKPYDPDLLRGVIVKWINA